MRIIIALALMVAQLVPAYADDPELQIRALDREIFLDLVKLAEFNIRYQIEVNHIAKWRTLTYPLAQEAAYACITGYTINDMCLRSNAWNNPGLLSSTPIKNGLASATIGTLLGAGSSVIQLAANCGDAIRSGRRGFSSSTATEYVHTTVQRIDDSLAQRHRLMSNIDVTGSRRELLELKEQLLNYERDRLVFEYRRWNSHSRGYFWYRNAFYIINSTVNFTRFAGAMCAYKSFTNKGCGGAVGPLLLISSVLGGAGARASTMVGNWVERRQTKALAERLPASAILSDEEAKKKFERLADLLEDNKTSGQHNQILSELVRLREEKVGLDRLIFSEERNIQRRRKVAGQQAIAAPVLSGFGSAAGIISTVNYYGYRQQPGTGTRLAMAGDISTLTAESGALLATPAAVILTLAYEHNLKKRGEHPDQLLPARLNDLKVLRTTVEEAGR